MNSPQVDHVGGATATDDATAGHGTAAPGGSLSTGAMALAVLVLAGITAARRPTGITQATIWAEDGQEFMSRAWTGLAALAQPYAGQFWPVQRAIAWLIGLAPTTWWPVLLYVTSCVAIGALAAIPLQRRAADLFGPLPYRALLSLLIVLLPATFETQGNITNLHWWALGSLLVVLALADPVSRGGRVVELVFVAVVAVTGPAGLLALPVVLWRLLAGPRTRYLWTRSAVVVAGAAVAAVMAVVGGRATGNDVVVADLPAFLYVRWGGSLTLGDNVMASRGVGVGSTLLGLGAVLIALLLTLVVLDRRGPSWAWLLVGLGAAVAGAMIGMKSGDGASLLVPRNIERYLLPLLYASVLVMVRGAGAGGRPRAARAVAVVALMLTAVGVVGDARLPTQGAAVDRAQLVALVPCYAGEPPYQEAVGCVVDVQPPPWKLVILRPGYEKLADYLREQGSGQ